MKPQTPPLPPGTFIPGDSYDPLHHQTADYFWYLVEPYFSPITEGDVEQLQPVVVPAPEVPSLGSVRVNAEDGESSVLARLHSYPLSQRLNAAFLDEGRGAANAAKSVRSGLQVEDQWIEASPDAMREYNEALEGRLKHDLQQLGLLDPECSDDLVSNLRMEHWHLQNVSATNSTKKRELSRRVFNELATQAVRRESKEMDDRTEISYIESMIEKSGKRGKGRFTKLLNQMHPNRNLLAGDPLPGTNKHTATAVDEKGGVTKKRKKKQALNDRAGLKNQSEQSSQTASEAADNIAPQIADIIWKHNNQATVEEIVEDFVKRVLQSGGDTKEARRRITNCISFSRKPFRFKKLPDGVTYSAARV